METAIQEDFYMAVEFKDSVTKQNLMRAFAAKARHETATLLPLRRPKAKNYMW